MTIQVLYNNRTQPRKQSDRNKPTSKARGKKKKKEVIDKLHAYEYHSKYCQHLYYIILWMNELSTGMDKYISMIRT